MSNLTNVESIVFNCAAYHRESGVGDGSGLFTDADVQAAFKECQEQLNIKIHPSYRPVNLVDMTESILFPPTVGA